MLTGKQRAEVQHALAYALVTSDAPHGLIQAIFPDPEEHRAVLGEEWTNNMGLLASRTLTACLLSRWTRTPPMLETLLDYLIDVRGVGAFKDIRQQVRDHADPSDSAYDATWLLDNSRPFFDRHDLRAKARALIEGNGKTVLWINCNGSGYGRTYSLEFFKHIESSRPGDVKVLGVEVPDGSGPSFTVEDLLAQLAGQLGIDERKLPGRTGSEYPAAALNWLFPRLMETGCRYVLAFDGFDQEPFRGQSIAYSAETIEYNEVHRTIQQLAHRTAGPQYRQRVRLALLDYPQPLKGVQRAEVITELLSPAAGISQADLLPCLEAWNELRRRANSKAAGPGDLDALVERADGLLADLPADGRERLETLHGRLLDLLELPPEGFDGAA